MIFSYTIKKGRAKDKITFESNPNLQYQTFHYYKLLITLNPLEYGKLLRKQDNVYTIQVNKTNVAIITQYNDFNDVEFYREGELVYKYKDHKIDESTFIRSLENKKIYIWK